MFWKVLMFHVIAMPVIMLAYFVVALAAPQLGLFNGAGLAWGAAVSFVVALPVAFWLSKQISKSTKASGG